MLILAAEGKGENMKRNLSKLKKAYVAIAKEMILYQPGKEKSISLDPFVWLEVQILIEDYFKQMGINSLKDIKD